ncbi:hypothetical protein D6D05_07303 [Aureobasidium pullulans]|nr:hypothetical protein D6D05_07303 [Aureobasidium pullulans]
MEQENMLGFSPRTDRSGFSRPQVMRRVAVSFCLIRDNGAGICGVVGSGARGLRK